MENQLQELQLKIQQYEDQIGQVNEFLSTDSTNIQFLQLRDDLNKALALTNDLLQAHSNQDFDNYDEDIDDIIGNNEDDSPFIKAKLPQKTGILNVGEIIEVLAGERPYAGIIISINHDDQTCNIKYFEHDVEVTLPLESINRIQPGIFTRDDIKPGFKCQCKYSQDQNYYDAEVSMLTKFGCLVTYTQYGNKEEVPIEYLRQAKPAVKKSDKNTDSKGLISIPDKLKILPSDTEEEKNRKRKRLKAIKLHNRTITKEIEMKETQQTWKSFIAKGAKKTLGGVVKKSSIFASTDDIDSKIGVTNSGKGTTDFVQRKKHKF